MVRIVSFTGNVQADVEAILAVASDFIAEALDKELGDDVTDGSIFRAHAAKYEVLLGGAASRWGELFSCYDPSGVWKHMSSP